MPAADCFCSVQLLVVLVPGKLWGPEVVFSSARDLPAL